MIFDELKKVNTLIKEEGSFALYRIPGEDRLHLVHGDNTVRLFGDIEELNGEAGFVIAPYHVSETSPIVLIQAERKEIPFRPEELRITFSPARKSTKTSPANEEYSRCFTAFTGPIKEKRFKKLVLSHSVTIEKEEAFSPPEAFLAACVRYPRSYVYLCHTPQTGTWLGSTPEMLLSGEGNIWNTVAIAGTQLLQKGKLPTNWDDKNLIEQMLVAYYIRMQLSSFDIHAVEKGPYTVRAGNLAHLRSDYHFSLPKDDDRLGSLLKLLHPTPAVSGLPKEEARAFILRNEGYDRKYYSGFIGWMEPRKKSDLYVNLRCMNIQEKTLTLYAGGGLLPSSVMADEWKETQDKLQTMYYIAKTKNYVFE